MKFRVLVELDAPNSTQAMRNIYNGWTGADLKIMKASKVRGPKRKGPWVVKHLGTTVSIGYKSLWHTRHFIKVHKKFYKTKRSDYSIERCL